MRGLVVTLAIAVTMAGAQTAQAASKHVQAMRSHIDTMIDATWQRQHMMGIRLTPTNRSYRGDKSAAYIGWVEQHWKHANHVSYVQFQSPPHRAAFMCIHRFEGSWPSNTGNGYYGGLQMDLGFQQTYAPHLLRSKGTADHWTPLEQIWVAEKAARSRGFYPWPNTARYCGLI